MNAELSANALIERYIPVTSQARYELQFTPAPQRHGAAALLSFEREMRALVALQQDVAPAKIHWWHEELQRLADGAPRHPLCQALLPYSSESLSAALNEMLHGAVMDFNSVAIDAQTQQRYFRMRGGALHAALAETSGATPDRASDELAKVMAITEILADARDPAHAGIPAASLAADGDPDAADADPAVAEAPLRQLREQAAAALAGQRAPSATSAVRLALYNARWPLIMATAYGNTPPSPSPWRTLFTAWRAASRFARQGTNA